MFEEPHIAYLVSDTRDKYNNISSTSDVEFNCMIEEGSQFLYESGQPQRLGRGIIYTSSTLTFTEGDKIKVGNDTWVIKRRYTKRDNGIFHHIEIIYG